MAKQGVCAVTGAFGYSGRHIAQKLLERGCVVRTLTNSPPRGASNGRTEVAPLHFDRPQELVESLRGVSILFNTYWVRFNRSGCTFADAVANTKILFDAARQAGVGRIVHLSVTNASLDSPLAYFRNKAVVEHALQESGASYAILRPAVLFGDGGVLINNIAWMLRHLPVLGVFGRGDYRLQPISVDDLAESAVEWGFSHDNATLNAIGPETFSYRELVEAIGRAIGRRRPIVSTPTWLGYLASLGLGVMLRDVVVTRDEITALTHNLLCVDAPPLGATRLTDWLAENAASLGVHYINDLRRR